ncbi:hypothetical protein ACQ4M4_06395 [Leptolyngbya sp. AN02str]|uniref:hypothetical protein n=1 Tax=Leptolyngbya sp. AN02str TaxID=3423363 RepID=UPI003D31803B
MRDRSDRYQISAVAAPSKPKRLGGYLLEAGLITTDQVDVALNDQRATGMKFGEVVVARGWVKEQTVEWIVQKVIKPERNAYQRWEQQQKKIAAEQLNRNPKVAMGHIPEPSARSKSTPVVSPQPIRPQPVPEKRPPSSAPSAPLVDDVNWLG